MKWDFKHIAITGAGVVAAALLIYLVYRHEQNASAASQAASDAAAQAAATQAANDQSQIDSIGAGANYGESSIGSVASTSSSGDTADQLAEQIIESYLGTGSSGTSSGGSGVSAGSGNTGSGATQPTNGYPINNPPDGGTSGLPGSGTPVSGQPIFHNPGSKFLPATDNAQDPAGSGVVTRFDINPAVNHGANVPAVINAPAGTYHSEAGQQAEVE